LAGLLSIHHDPCYHELQYLSNDIVVLAFGKLNYFVRTILQAVENKGVEFTGGWGYVAGRGMTIQSRAASQLVVDDE
jgi:hypothetical protein